MTQPARELDPAHSARDLYGVELRRQRQLAGLSLDLSMCIRDRRSWMWRLGRGSCSRGCGGW